MVEYCIVFLSFSLYCFSLLLTGLTSEMSNQLVISMPPLMVTGALDASGNSHLPCPGKEGATWEKEHTARLFSKPR